MLCVMELYYVSHAFSPKMCGVTSLLIESLEGCCGLIMIMYREGACKSDYNIN